MPETRFLKLDDVCEELNISNSQARALVRSGDLPAIQVGGRGQWRIERSKLEDYIARMYEQAARNLDKIPDHDDGSIGD